MIYTNICFPNSADAICQVRSRIQEGRLICHLYHKNVDMKNSVLAANTWGFNPYVINWSNVPDYLNKDTFIKFAQDYSTKQTKHYVTFINGPYYISIFNIFKDYLLLLIEHFRRVFSILGNFTSISLLISH